MAQIPSDVIGLIHSGRSYILRGNRTYEAHEEPWFSDERAFNVTIHNITNGKNENRKLYIDNRNGSVAQWKAEE